MSDVLNFILFADDTTIYCSGPNLTELVLVVEKKLYKLKNWFDLNKLSLNLNKTKFMVFSNKELNNEIRITINKNILEE